MTDMRLRLYASRGLRAAAAFSSPRPLRLRWAAILSTLVFFTGVAAEELVTLNFTNAEIDAVVRAIAQFTGKTFVVDPRVKGTVNITIEQPLTRDQAMAALSAALRLQGVALVEVGGVMRVVPEADAKLQGGAVQSERVAGAARGDELVTQVFRLNYESAVSLVPMLRPLVAPSNSVSAIAASNSIVITDYAENVRRVARIIAAIDTPASSNVEIVRLQNVVASDLAVLLGRILDGPVSGGDASQRVIVLAEPSSNSLLVRATSPARANLVRTLIAKLDQPSAVPGNIRVVYLKNAEAARLARTLLGVAAGESASPGPAASPSTSLASFQTAGRTQGTSPPASSSALIAAGQVAPVSGQIAGAHIQADPTTNTLIVTAPDAVYRHLRAVIDKLDVRRAQVFIESLIVEVTSDQAAEFGVQWQTGLQRGAAGSDAGAIGGTNFGAGGQNILGVAANPGSVGAGLNIGVSRGQITLPGIGTITNLQFLARALEQSSKANILSTPNILTLDNEEARIIVGQNVPFITGQFVTSASGSSATVNPFQTIERRDVGLTLRVRPQISEGGAIKLVIYQEVSSVQAPSTAGPITNMRAIETNVLVDDGAIVVLGGLVQDSVTSGVDKVPLLGDIPLLGHLFRFETRKQQKTNLMVFLRPFVVRDDTAARSLVVDRYDQMRLLEETTRQAPHLLLPEMAPPVLPPLEQGAPPPTDVPTATPPR